MSVYPTFPESPEPGDLFPAEPDPDETQFEYLSDQVGWVKKVIALQGPDGDAIWPGRLQKVTAFPPIEGG